MSESGSTAGTATLPNDTTGRRDLVSLGLLGALAFVVTADARVVDPLLPVIADDFATSIASAGLAVAVLAAIFALRVLTPTPGSR